MLDILDTAGQEEYSAMRDDYMGKGDGFLMVYSITDNQSFYECKKIWEALVRMKTPEDPNEPMPKIPIVLVGNKIDLEDERCVVEEDVQEFIQELGDYCKWFETSALTRHNVDEIFEQVVRLILAAENGQDPNGEKEKQEKNNKEKEVNNNNKMEKDNNNKNNKEKDNHNNNNNNQQKHKQNHKKRNHYVFYCNNNHNNNNNNQQKHKQNHKKRNHYVFYCNNNHNNNNNNQQKHK
eukprot:CAMPEP_0117423232 /NCGR_PEP_ID=MMETSP0758-20121206/3905_1 /TAXON_ID=63605 /ORGANISM="Percolomonas cosmopolitus, Strain AE-1 (ATCC 50343)" /LENGTH=235 /DNA_ID=CAMNT_0005206313 /DNA_START=180 /DNA_END=885 /DNA_ORIENTATION=+